MTKRSTGKRDIVPLARLDNGLGIFSYRYLIFSYRYLWSDQVFVGVMTQGVALVAPCAIIRGDDGYLQTWEQWAAAN
jgi:hypothetical protein